MISTPTSNTAGMAARYLTASCALAVLLYFGRDLFIPMSYGLLIAIVMAPPSRWLEQKGWPRNIAILMVLTIVIALFAGLVLLLSWQLSLFRQDMPMLVARLKPLSQSFSNWLSSEWSLSPSTQQQWLEQTLQSGANNLGNWLQLILTAITGTLFSLFLIPIYAALFLYHRKIFVQFIYKLLPRREAIIAPALGELVNTYHRYIKGMVLVYLIVGVLNSIGLLALGIQHAILFGMLTAIMTIIPYVGIVVSAALPVSLAFISTGTPWLPLAVIAVFSFVQYLEANIIFPRVVGAQLNVSTWATLVAIIAGGILWGVSGMILFIPFVAMLKIISGYVPSLHALHFILARNQIDSI